MSATAVPVDSQRLAALRVANEKRFRWAAFKADMRAEAVDVGATLFVVPSAVRDMPVGEFLKAVPYVGPKKRNAMLADVGASASRALGELTERQRTMLVSMLPARRGGGQ